MTPATYDTSDVSEEIETDVRWTPVFASLPAVECTVDTDKRGR